MLPGCLSAVEGRFRHTGRCPLAADTGGRLGARTGAAGRGRGHLLGQRRGAVVLYAAGLVQRLLPRHGQRKQVRWRPSKSAHRIPLLPDERGSILAWPSINTVTFYRGIAPVHLLRERLWAVVAENPWLCGRLLEDETGVHLWIPRKPSPRDCLVEMTRPGLNPDMPLEATRREVEDVLVPKGTDCIDCDEPLFRVAVVHLNARAEEQDNQRFAVVVSLSHVLGDAHTYYQVYGALGSDPHSHCRPFLEWFGKDGGTALDPRREPQFPYAAAVALGPTKVMWLNSKPAQLGGRYTKLFKPPHRWSAWQVDMEWVQEQKREWSAAGTGSAAAESAPTRAPAWVSTNDVLTSWFLRRGGYAYGFMSVNFRGRLCRLSDSNAGNYEAGIQFWPDEFQTPAGIRRSLLSPARFQAGRTDTPGWLTSIRGKFGVATNWASVQKALHLPGCKQLLHLPVVSKITVDGVMIVFRPMPGALAVVLAERRGAAWDLDAQAALASRIC